MGIGPIVHSGQDRKKGELSLRNFEPGLAVVHYVRIKLGPSDVKFVLGPGESPNVNERMKALLDAVYLRMPPELRFFGFTLGTGNPLAFLRPGEDNVIFSLGEALSASPSSGATIATAAEKAAMLKAFAEVAETMQLDICYTDLLGIRRGKSTTLGSDAHLDKDCPAPPATIELEEMRKYLTENLL